MHASHKSFFCLSTLGRPSRICVLAVLALFGSLLLGGTYLPTVSYFWGLGTGRVLLALALLFLPTLQAGRFRPYLLTLSSVGLLASLFLPYWIFTQWVLITLLYLLLEISIDSLVLQHATEQEVPLELGILAACRFLGLWGGLIWQHSDLALEMGKWGLPQVLLAFLSLFWLLVRESPDCRLLSPKWKEKVSGPREVLQNALQEVLKVRAAGSILSLFFTSFLAGYLCDAILPYPLLHPTTAESWVSSVESNLQLLLVGLFATWMLEKARLRTQLLFAATCLMGLAGAHLLGLSAPWPAYAFGFVLTSILLCIRAVLRETFKLDPVLRAALVITVWTSGGLTGETLRADLSTPWTQAAELIACVVVLAFVLLTFRHYNRSAQYVETKIPHGKAERFGDRTQDFHGVPTSGPRKKSLRFFRHLSNYLLVHLPVTIILSAVAVGLLVSGLYIFDHRAEWETRLKNSEKVFRTKIFYSGFKRRLQEEMIASQRVPSDWPGFIADNFNSDGKALTDIDPWGTPYLITVHQKEVEIQSAGPDRRFGTADDLSTAISRPTGVKS